jgi:hypothetical protein
MGEYERMDYRYAAMEQAERVRWECERPGVFAGWLGERIIGRVAAEQDRYGWDWAVYRNGWTHDSGKTDTFAAACAAVERAHKETPEP